MSEPNQESNPLGTVKVVAILFESLITLAQLAGVAAIVVGVWLALPSPYALIVDGVLVLAIGVAMELVLSRRKTVR